MTDTAESVRTEFQFRHASKEAKDMGLRYAALLERIEKAPVVLLFNNGQIMGTMGEWKPADVEKLGGKRVALVEVE